MSTDKILQYVFWGIVVAIVVFLVLGFLSAIHVITIGPCPCL